KNLLKEGKSVTFAFDSSGFHSMSSFINAFRSRTSMTPSEYKRSKKK
ncbi:MAG: helix-turn-helix domain-containing protein, partial [Clostridia bacterium]|nr:helix-turn-helix domain-containing protein [Clostridia bacterium]